MKQSFFLLALLVSFPQISETIYTPSLPELAKLFHSSENLMQQTLSIYFWGFALGVFCFGRLCDLIGRKKSMLLGILIYTLASALCLLVKSIEFLMFARFIQALGASVGSVVTQTMLRDTYRGEERAKIFSKLTAIIAFAPAIGPAIGSRLSYLFSPMANFWFLFFMGVILLFGSTRLKETLNNESLVPIRMRPLFWRMLKDKQIWLVGFFIAAHNGIIFSLHAEAPFILIETLKMAPEHYGLFGLTLAAPFFLASMINVRLLKIYSPYQMNVLGTLIMLTSTSLLVLILPQAAEIPLFRLRGIFLLSIFATSFGMGISLPNCLSISLKNYQDCVGTAGAIFGLIYYSMIGVFLGIMGLIHNGTLWPMPVYFVVLSLALFGGALSLARRKALSSLVSEKI